MNREFSMDAPDCIRNLENRETKLARKFDRSYSIRRFRPTFQT